DDQNSDSVRVFHAFALAANRQPAKAVDELEDVVDPAFEANFHMGIVHFQDGDFEQAAKTFLKVKPDSPLYPKAKHNAAISLERSGKAGSAAAILARAPPVAEMQKAFDHQATGQNVREPASPSDLKPESLQPQLEWSLPVL
ncbi:MAG: hypothetical protein V4692_15220, partial [Bdellovibrionota bacterium]